MSAKNFNPQDMLVHLTKNSSDLEARTGYLAVETIEPRRTVDMVAYLERTDFLSSIVANGKWVVYARLLKWPTAISILALPELYYPESPAIELGSMGFEYPADRIRLLLDDNHLVLTDHEKEIGRIMNLNTENGFQVVGGWDDDFVVQSVSNGVMVGFSRADNEALQVRRFDNPSKPVFRKEMDIYDSYLTANYLVVWDINDGFHVWEHEEGENFSNHRVIDDCIDDRVFCNWHLVAVQDGHLFGFTHSKNIYGLDGTHPAVAPSILNLNEPEHLNFSEDRLVNIARHSFSYCGITDDRMLVRGRSRTSYIPLKHELSYQLFSRETMDYEATIRGALWANLVHTPEPAKVVGAWGEGYEAPQITAEKRF
ncbi:hypothetical protein KY320_00845 [Candidatus Woesearchaeota archaeon]|nr:hypothetical protein [Candidatus Woesearchaeota archaeon]